MLEKQIENITDARQFVDWLIDHDKLFHFEDCPHEIINTSDDKATFTTAEADRLTGRVAELYSIDWQALGYECPCDLALEISGIHGDRNKSVV